MLPKLEILFHDLIQVTETGNSTVNSNARVYSYSFILISGRYVQMQV
jgi:hypothetical protein